MPLIRAAVLTNLDQVARFAGIDPMPLLRAEGITLAEIADGERMIPLVRATNVLEAAARISGREDFGLLMAESRTLGSVGPLSLLLAHEPTVGDIIDAVVDHQSLLGDAINIRSVPYDDAQLVSVELPGTTDLRQITELVIALSCRCIGAIVEHRWTPESIHFPHSPPADARMLRRFFTCPIDFNSDFSGFVCPRSALREANPAGDGELVGHAEHFLALIAPPTVDNLSDAVRRSLRMLVPEQRGTIEEVSKHLGAGTRTLQRQLLREGFTFAALLNEVRRDLSVRHLSASLPLSHVAEMVGYQRASSFTRWFNTEFGMPPAAWRRHRGAVSERRAAE